MTNQTVSNNNQKNKVNLESSPNIFDGATDLSKADIKQHQKSVPNNDQNNNQKPSIFDGFTKLDECTDVPVKKEKSVVDNLSPTGKESMTTQRVEVPEKQIVYKLSSHDFEYGIFLGFAMAFVAIFAARKMFAK